MITANDLVIIDLGEVVKASSGESGERLVAVEASNEQSDSEGDVILQKALLDSADSFLKNGHLDIDHISEIGHRMHIQDPHRYIVGYPNSVHDIGEHRTAVKGTIFKNKDGSVDPVKYVYDSFWCSLNTDPPTKWRASIYGNAKDVGTKPGVKRHVVTSIDWKSLAFTRRPVNQGLKGEASIITAKAYVEELKSESSQLGTFYDPPAGRDDMIHDYTEHLTKGCPCTDAGSYISVSSVRNHFMKCRGLSFDYADLASVALISIVKSRFEK